MMTLSSMTPTTVIRSPDHHPVTTSTPYMNAFFFYRNPHIVFTPQHSAPAQTWSEVFQLPLQFISFALLPHISFFFPTAQYTGAWLPLYLCDGDISSMTWGPFMLSLQHNHTSSLYLDGVRGAQQPSGEAYRHTPLYHLWQPINTSLTFLILI